MTNDRAEEGTLNVKLPSAVEVVPKGVPFTVTEA